MKFQNYPNYRIANVTGLGQNIVEIFFIKIAIRRSSFSQKFLQIYSSHNFPGSNNFSLALYTFPYPLLHMCILSSVQIECENLSSIYLSAANQPWTNQRGQVEKNNRWHIILRVKINERGIKSVHKALWFREKKIRKFLIHVYQTHY